MLLLRAGFVNYFREDVFDHHFMTKHIKAQWLEAVIVSWPYTGDSFYSLIIIMISNTVR